MLILRDLSLGGGCRRYCITELSNMRMRLLNDTPLVYLKTRTYVSIDASRDEGNNIHHDLKWPITDHPTPYEVFGIQHSSSLHLNTKNLDKRRLKKQYHEYAKLYHPDISQNIKIIRSPIHMREHDTDLLSYDEKLLRFKIMTEAYNILSNSQKRNLYDCTKAGWAYGPSGGVASSGNYAYPSGHGYQSNSAYEYWNAGTWEDMNDLKSTGSEKERLNAWTVFMWICGLVVCLEATALLTRIENSLTSNQYTHEETELDLAQCYTNYGLDPDKFSRFRRFLWFRTYGLYRAKDDLDREAKKNENIVQQLMKAADSKNCGANDNDNDKSGSGH